MAENGTRRWTRDENILVFNLYLTIPFGQMHSRNARVIELAELIGRTSGAVALKLSNFASLDPDLQSRGVRGMAHRSAADKQIWDEFVHDRESLAFESELLRAQLRGESVERAAGVSDLPPGIEGREREALVRVRVNQGYFRKMILARYEYRCCITGLNLEPLLTASHIVPWAEDRELRLDPRNGLCLNALHDRAFDNGLLAVDDDFRVRVRADVRSDSEGPAYAFLLRFDGAPLNLPKGAAPSPDLLRRHRARFGFETLVVTAPGLTHVD